MNAIAVIYNHRRNCPAKQVATRTTPSTAQLRIVRRLTNAITFQKTDASARRKTNPTLLAQTICDVHM